MTTTTTSTPRWLEAYGTRTGTDPALTGTRAVPRHCRTCRRLILAGYDAPTIAGLAIADPYALTPQLEAAAVILAIVTWRLCGRPGHYELTPRHTPGLPPLCRRDPAGPAVTVLAAHRCEYPPLSRIPLPSPNAHRAADPDHIPF